MKIICESITTTTNMGCVDSRASTDAVKDIGQQGIIKGQVAYWSVGPDEDEKLPCIRDVVIFQGKMALRQPWPEALAGVRTDYKGMYQFTVRPGAYTVVLRENYDLYLLRLVDHPYDYHTLQVEAGQTLIRDLCAGDSSSIRIVHYSRTL
jgi:hypothetical protein